MKAICILMLLLSMLVISSKSYTQDEFPVLQGPYLGQTPPGLTPEAFAPGIVTTEHYEFGGAFSPDMKEFYLLRNGGKYEKYSLVVFKSQNNQWRESIASPSAGRPFVSPDGKTIHLGKRYLERTEAGLSERKSLGLPFEDIRIMRLTASSKGTYVFDEAGTDGDGVIRYSRLIDGKREVPRMFSKEINTGTWNAHPFIAPDESYILWDGRRDSGFGDSDIYISFRQLDDSWGKAINLGGKINTAGWDASASVTPDGKYLFFHREISPGNLDIFWVDAKIIEDLRPQGANDSAPMVSAADAKLSFGDMSYLKNPYIETTPNNRKDSISLGELGIDGGNKEIIVELALEIADGKHGLFDSLLIAHKGKLLFESYYLRGRVDLPHRQASATKSYLSLAVGRAIQLGYLTMSDLDKPLVSFLKELDPTKFVVGAEKITLHKALTMRSGMRITWEQMKEFEKNPSQLKGQGQIQTFLEHSPPVSEESQSFHYQRADPTWVMQVLDAVVPGTAKDFIKNELLEKLGISNYNWQDDVSGLPMGSSGSNMTSRDMLKWGTLVMNKGKWNGEQLVPEAFVTKATNRIVDTNDDDIFFVGDNVVNSGYGYYFWQADMKVGSKTYFSTSAQGGGGQYIILIEELDLIVVTTAHESDDSTMQIMAQRVLPAFIK